MSNSGETFVSGAFVLLTLHSPREKYFGTLQALTPAGITLRGMDINSLEDFVAQVKAGDHVSTGIVFLPMYRVEKMEMDQSSEHVPSIQATLSGKTGGSLESIRRMFDWNEQD
jgi:hypothetical protein